MEDINQDLDGITIRCFLCKGYVPYKDGDSTRFKAHLANQHGAFFDFEYILASCFLDDSQKQSIAQPTLDSLKTEILPNGNDEPKENSKVKKEKSSKTKSKKLEKPKVKKEKALKSKKKKAQKAPEQAGDVVQSVAGEQDQPSPGPEVSLKEQVEMTFNAAADSLLEELNMELESLDSSMDVTVDENEKSLDYGENSALEENNDEGSEPVVTKKKMRKKSEKGSNTSTDSRWKTLTESLAKHGIDIAKSSYFSKTRQVLSNGEKFQDKFTEVLPGLPDNWKFRTVDAKDKGKVVVHKHFLSPEGALMKSTMAVVEYLRIEGKLNNEEIMEVARTLKVGQKKLQKLFSNQVSEEA